jgi:hypothetical protein
MDMAAWVYKIVMLPGNMVLCGFYKNVSNVVIRLFDRLVNDVTFVAQARKPGLDMLRAALEAPLVHPLFRWLLDTIEGFKAREPEWQDRAEVWKWLKEGPVPTHDGRAHHGHGRIRLRQGGGSLGQDPT